MSRKYSSWASNPSALNADFSKMKLNTVTGNEQDQLKHFDRVEAIPHMYINVDAPPPPQPQATTRAFQPTTNYKGHASHSVVSSMGPASFQMPTKLWPGEKSSFMESASSTSKRTHKHKNHHHHHNDKHHHHHHRHHSRRHRAKSAESIRNRAQQTFMSSSKSHLANTSYVEQDQQQPMIVYREVGNGEGYTVNNNGLASVPYGMDNGGTFVDDQQAPMIVYRDANGTQQQFISDGTSQQQLFFNPDQETMVQQSDSMFGVPQQSSQFVYCTEPAQQDFLCNSQSSHCVHQSVASPVPQQQQQFFCLDNSGGGTIQPTMINQIPVFSAMPATTNSQSMVALPQASLQRTTSVIMPQAQAQQFQILQQPQQQQQQLQIIQQPQQLQTFQQPQQLQTFQQVQQPMQVLQQAQPMQIIANPAGQPTQLIQLSSGTPQMIQSVQPQIIQAAPMLQTMHMSPQATMAATPQILYQRPYDPVMIPVQQQPMAMAAAPMVALSQPSYAPSRLIPAGQPQGPNMFRHALLRTVADRSGMPIHTQAMNATAGMQLVQPNLSAGVASNSNLHFANGLNRSASAPIIPLTPGGLLIPFQPSQIPGQRPGALPRAGGYPSALRNFNDIQRQIQQRSQLLSNMQQQQQQQPYTSSTARVPSPPILSTGLPSAPLNRTPYAPGGPLGALGRLGGAPLPPLGGSGAYNRPASSGLSYVPPSMTNSNAGSILSDQTTPYRSLGP